MKVKDRPSKIDYDFDCPLDRITYRIDLENYADYAEERISTLTTKIQNINSATWTEGSKPENYA